LVPLALLLAVASCQDAAGPLAQQSRTGPLFSSVGNGDSDVSADSSAPYATPILRQAAGAPSLETYQVSFWLSRDKAKQVVVRYRPTAAESQGEPFLLFDVPKDGLHAGAGGATLAKKDSIEITLTIDPATFQVQFEPSGVLFSERQPATLVFWYQNADLDLNGDGVVNGADRDLAAWLRIVYRRDGHAHWHKTKSMKGWTAPYVFAPIHHFSSYAVSW
jgi:hypothetical protein